MDSEEREFECQDCGQTFEESELEERNIDLNEYYGAGEGYDAIGNFKCCPYCGSPEVEPIEEEAEDEEDWEDEEE